MSSFSQLTAFWFDLSLLYHFPLPYPQISYDHFAIFVKSYSDGYDKIMQQLPDIRALYQRKYIQSSYFPSSHEVRDTQDILRRTQRFEERMMARSTPQKKLNCIKIIKEKPHTFRLDNSQKSTNPPQHTLRRFSSTVIGKTAQSLHPKNELVRQIMHISQQELTDLQSSLGGEKTLIQLLNSFFEKRHHIRSQRSPTSFKPMQNLFNKRYGEEEKSQQIHYRINKQPTRADPRPKDKELAPWSVQDIEFA